ncbi:MAG: hypothetical protein V1870_03060 [Candidatus Aenigmatarchaeota archaeon]
MYCLTGSVPEDYTLLKRILLLEEQGVNDDNFKRYFSCMKDSDHQATHIRHVMFYIDRFGEVDSLRDMINCPAKELIGCTEEDSDFDYGFDDSNPTHPELEGNAYTMELIRCFIDDHAFDVDKTYISHPNSRHSDSRSSQSKAMLKLDQ